MARRIAWLRWLCRHFTETLDPANALQLKTDVRVAFNTAENVALLAALLPAPKQNAGLDALWTDGAFGSPPSETVLRVQQVMPIQTAIVGRQPGAEKLRLVDFARAEHAQGFK